MQTGSEFFRSNFTYITEIYKKFLKNPSSVDASWVQFFASLSDDEKILMHDAEGAGWELEKTAVIGKRNELSSLPLNEANEVLAQEKANEKKKKDALALAQKEGLTAGGSLEMELMDAINEIRSFGHLEAKLDPLNLMQIQATLKFPNLEKDLEKTVTILGVKAKVGEHLARFREIYCSKLGSEVSHIKNKQEREWFYSKMENPIQIPNENRKYALEMLIKAESFEHALHLKFPGAKRFSAEGGEGVISALEQIFLTSSELGANDFIIGMAHRARLNVLTHTLGKPYYALFSEFMGVSSIPEGVPGSGDVKYHLGLDTDRKLINGKEIKVSLTPNPSHLESVNPVVMGRVRAKQDLKWDYERKKVVPILIHGDAAMAGQGIVYECLQMANLKGYTVGGTIHIIINNQVGFTATLKEAKSGTYSSDVSKAIDAPILHVNASEGDSVLKAVIIASEYRQTFGKDVVIELIGYRKYGHNEGDEPMFTQPVMYSVIKNITTPADIYFSELSAKKIVTESFNAEFREKTKAILDAEYEKAKTYKPTEADWLKGRWSHIKRLENAKDLFGIETKIDEKTFDIVGGAISLPPEGFNINPKIKKLLDDRKMALLAGDKIDWATAELLAYGSLMLEGFPVRLSGEDCERGTFSHRHSVYYDQTTNARFEPLNNMKVEKKARYEVINSLLSEYGVLGYEYGYSIQTPDALTIWEAQYGDFANGAVTIYDQYISSGEDKWLKMSGLVNLLPHGFEGQGPEHSSARLERYLQYAAENNIIVCNITTPANFFHALRRQLKMPYRKPMIVMSPKSLFRHKLVNSTMKEFTEGEFKPILSDLVENKKTAKKVIFTSGKVFYDLHEARELAGKQAEIAIIRIEQYYPFASEIVKQELSGFKVAKEFLWVQEEPKNMGAWSFIRDYLTDATNAKVSYVGRSAKPSPATGFASVHAREQKELIAEALK